MGTFSSGTPTIAIGVYYGIDPNTKTNDTPIGTSTASATLANNLSNVGWSLDYTIICYSTTAMSGQGVLTYANSNTASTAGISILQTQTSTAGTTVASTTAKNLYLFPAYAANQSGNTSQLMQLIVTGN
jgi:hypothetical protein